MLSKEDLLKMNPYWVETVDGAFTLAVRMPKGHNSEGWNTSEERDALVDIAREQLEKSSGQKVQKLDSS